MSKAPERIAVHPAIARYAPQSISRVANSVLNPDLERQVAMLKARPKSIRRIPAKMVENVLALVRDVNTIAAILKTGDNRRITRLALSRHPLSERAANLIVDRDNPWNELELEEIKSELGTILQVRSLTIDEIRKITTWCRRQSGIKKRDAYLQIYNLDPTGRSAIPDLLTDIVLGRVEGLTIEDLGHAIIPEKRYAFTRPRIGTMNDVVARYERLDLPLARMCTENGIKPPLDSVDIIDEEAFQHLLSEGSALALIEEGMLDDPRRLLPYIDKFDNRLRSQIAFQISDTDVIAALVKDLVYGKGKYIDLFSLLTTAPCFDLETRMTLLTYASATELRDYINGMTLNQPEEGDGIIIVKRLLDPEQDRWNISGPGTLAYVIGMCAPTPCAVEAANTFINVQEGSMSLFLDNGGFLGRVAVGRITAILADDKAKWEMLLRLAPDWSGTLDGLIATANVL